MTDRLLGKTAFITGAAQGIGRAIAEAFAAEGASVIASDMNADALKALDGMEGIRTAVLNVTDLAGIKACAAQFSDCDILVNCSGIVCNGTILDCTEDEWERSLSVNVTSMFHTIRAFLPAMLERKSGAIVNIASVVSSIKGAPNRFAYGASKAGVIGLTRSVARDFIEQGVRCNSICPGTVDSPSLQERMRAGGDYDRDRQAFIDRQPMKRLGRAEEIAAVAVMLASDESAFITGTETVIDGGWSL